MEKSSLKWLEALCFESIGKTRHTTFFLEQPLLACVDRVGRGRAINLEKGVGLPIRIIGSSFICFQGALQQILLTVGGVNKQNELRSRVNILSHSVNSLN